jgi:hypothetical protein
MVWTAFRFLPTYVRGGGLVTHKGHRKWMDGMRACVLCTFKIALFVMTNTTLDNTLLCGCDSLRVRVLSLSQFHCDIQI